MLRACEILLLLRRQDHLAARTRLVIVSVTVSLARFYIMRPLGNENDSKRKDAVLLVLFFRKDGTGYRRQIAPSSQSVWYIRGCDLRPRRRLTPEIRRRSLATRSNN